MMRPNESLAKKRIKSYKIRYVSHHTDKLYQTTYHLSIFRSALPRLFYTQSDIDMTQKNPFKVIETQRECRDPPTVDQHVEVCF